MVRVASNVAFLLAGTCSSQAVHDQSLLIQRTLEVDWSTEECPAGYKLVPGDFGGWDHFGRGMDNIQGSAQLCADDCDAHSGCESFEWSPTSQRCSLNKVPNPNLAPFSDYLFCQRDTGVYEAPAAQGTVTAPFVVAGDYVELPGPADSPCGENTCGGQILFNMYCTAFETVAFQVEVMAPDKYADSLYIQLDADAQLEWHTGRDSSWVWSRTSPSLSASQGSHAVILKGREDGIKIRSLKLVDGSTSCAFQLTTTTAPEDATQATGPAAAPGYAGFVFERLPNQNGEPSHLDMKLGSCDVDGRCVGLWGTDIGFVVQSTQSMPVTPNDTLSYSIDVDVSAKNVSNGLSRVLADKFIVGESCAICSGSCTAESTSAEYKFKVVRPTDWDNSDMCNAAFLGDLAANVTGTTLLNQTVSLPDWTEGQVEGHAYITSTLKDTADVVKSTDSFAIVMNATQVLSKHHKRRGAGEAVKKSLPGALLYTLKEAMHHTIEGVIEGAKAASLMSLANLRSNQSARVKREVPVLEHAILFNATMVEFAGQVAQNFTVSSSQVCNKIDDSGSFTCKVPMKTQPFDMSAFVNLEAVLEEGDYLNLTVHPRMGGLFGGIAERILKSQTVTLPLCGAAALVQTYGLPILVQEQRCGAYRLFYDRLVPKVMTAADLPITELPQVPDLGMDLSIEDFLPSGIEVGLEAFKKDGATIMKISGYWGIVTI